MRRKPQVIIVGGGFSGAMVALQLARRDIPSLLAGLCGAHRAWNRLFNAVAAPSTQHPRREHERIPAQARRSAYHTSSRNGRPEIPSRGAASMATISQVYCRARLRAAWLHPSADEQCTLVRLFQGW